MTAIDGRRRKVSRNDVLEKFESSIFDKSPLLGISLVATQLTVTAGIVASISGIGFYGIWFFAAPASFALGLLLFVQLLKTDSHNSTLRCRLTHLFSDENAPNFAFYFLLAVLILDIFLIGWEIYILTDLFAAYFSKFSASLATDYALVFISLLFAIPTAVYVSQGGWTQAVRTDLWQFAGIIVFVAILFPLVKYPADFEEVLTGVPVVATDLQVFLFVFPVFVINLIFPFVTLANWKVAESAGNRLGTVVCIALVLLIAFFTFIFLVAASLPVKDAALLFRHDGLGTVLLLAALPLFVWSTMDAKLVSLVRFLGPRLLRRRGAGRGQYTVTAACLLVAVCAVLVTTLLRSYAPDVLQALLGGVGSLIVFAPPIIALVSGRWRKQVGRPATIAFLLLFLVVLVAGMILSLSGQQGWVTIPAIAGFVASSLIVWRMSS